MKSKNFFLLVVCVGYFLLRGRAAKKVLNPKSVLVVQLAKMGDMVSTTPVFAAIKKNTRNAKFMFWETARMKSCLKAVPTLTAILFTTKIFLER